MVKKTIKTLARQAQDELLEESQNSALLQEDFATKAYQMDVVRIETTLAELNILLGMPAVIRSGFVQDDANKLITIPTVFAKVDGLPANEKPYWQHLDSIRDTNGLQALVTRHMNTSDWRISSEDFNAIMSNFTAQALQQSDAWAYQLLNKLLQNQIAEAIVALLSDWPFSVSQTIENQQFVLSVLLDLPKELLEMSLEVDYPKEVPLLAVVHQESLGELTFEDIVAFNMFHQLGWDVVVYSPHAFASLENYMTTDSYDKFSYDKIRTTSSATGDPKKSFLQKWFGN